MRKLDYYSAGVQKKIFVYRGRSAKNKKTKNYYIDSNIIMEQPSQGFDRSIDFLTIKDEFLRSFKDLLSRKPKTVHAIQVITRKIIYTLVALIQLRNGSRISEAVDALNKFFRHPQLSVYEAIYTEISVKIAKSKTLKVINKTTGEKKPTKTRFRFMFFPHEWIDADIEDLHNKVLSSEMIQRIQYFLNTDEGNLKKRTLDYLLRNFDTNSHSLRYSTINHLMYEKDVKPELVSKIVGHTDQSMLVRYTQQKQAKEELINLGKDL